MAVLNGNCDCGIVWRAVAPGVRLLMARATPFRLPVFAFLFAAVLPLSYTLRANQNPIKFPFMEG